MAGLFADLWWSHIAHHLTQRELCRMAQCSGEMQRIFYDQRAWRVIRRRYADEAPAWDQGITQISADACEPEMKRVKLLRKSMCATMRMAKAIHEFYHTDVFLRDTFGLPAVTVDSNRCGHVNSEVFNRLGILQTWAILGCTQMSIRTSVYGARVDRVLLFGYVFFTHVFTDGSDVFDDSVRTHHIRTLSVLKHIIPPYAHLLKRIDRDQVMRN